MYNRLFPMNLNCRNMAYPREPLIQRAAVADDKVRWGIPWPSYAPVSFTTLKILRHPEADPNFTHWDYRRIHFNVIDGKQNRVSFLGPYDVNEDGLPLNPCGRTGITGRGCLRFWGPNHAADPIVTRWKRDSKGEQYEDVESNLPILQFVAIKRQTGEWAIPGGMVDTGEEITCTLKREFSEEALNTTVLDEDTQQAILQKVGEAFQNDNGSTRYPWTRPDNRKPNAHLEHFCPTRGPQVYAGYVDDPRNTDNAWMETLAVNFHDETGSGLAMFPLEAGDDAKAVSWVDINAKLKLYANHRDFIKITAEKLNAFWGLCN